MASSAPKTPAGQTLNPAPNSVPQPAAPVSSAPVGGPPKIPGAVGNAEHYSAPLPPTQEAALLYASDRMDGAIQLLKLMLRDPVGKNNIQAWLMLMDLYQLTGNRKEFDALCMLFTVKFETSPPVWRDAAELDEPRRATKREVKDYFLLRSTSAGLSPEIERLRDFAQKTGSVRLDVGKLTQLADDEARILAGLLSKMRRAKMPFWFSNLEHLERYLKKFIAQGESAKVKGYWALLFEAYLLTQNHDAFDEVGVDYAVAYEESPPAWEAYVNPVAETAAKEGKERAAATEEAAKTGYLLRGVLAAANKAVLTELQAYAASHTEVNIDMSGALRLDFSMMDQLFDVVKSIQLAGKRVIISNLNELNFALLEAFLFNRHAILIRKKPI
jgi:anti-anti-sigma regulatory factor